MAAKYDKAKLFRLAMGSFLLAIPVTVAGKKGIAVTAVDASGRAPSVDGSSTILATTVEFRAADEVSEVSSPSPGFDKEYLATLALSNRRVRVPTPTSPEYLVPTTMNLAYDAMGTVVTK